MRKVMLFQLISILLFAGVLWPSFQYLLSGQPLPEREVKTSEPVVQQAADDGIKVAETTFFDQTISFYHYEDSSYLYYSSDKSGKPVHQNIQTEVHDDESTIYFYADLENEYRITENGTELKPVEILQITTENMEFTVPIYYLNKTKTIRMIDKEETSDYSFYCSNTSFCDASALIDPESFEAHIASSSWKEIEYVHVKRYIRNFSRICSISDNWQTYSVSMGGRNYGSSITLDWVQTEQNRYFFKLYNGFTSETTCYELNARQMDALSEFLKGNQ